MQSTTDAFHFDNTYLALPAKFYTCILPSKSTKPHLLLLNEELQKDLGLDDISEVALLEMLSGNHIPAHATPFAQAYAGHQFGHMNMLGDGRAIMLGEHIAPNGARYDIQLKGAGQTPYSRRGDGRATLRSMLREYLMSEAMHHLRIPTSRSLAVVETGDTVYRESLHRGAIMTRIMRSHLRIGTFEYARYFGSTTDLGALLDYTIARLFPTLQDSTKPALQLLEYVMHQQIDLVVDWMRVGFVHGVMNTDNTALSGETFDYGPCAFMNVYDPSTTYSSIDTQGRYAFGNQPRIIRWNIARLAEALLPLVDPDPDKAIAQATDVIHRFDSHFSQQSYAMMCRKIGIQNHVAEDRTLVDELLTLMLEHKLDYTHTFVYLSRPQLLDGLAFEGYHLTPWIEKWRSRISKIADGKEVAKSLMTKENPILIPRNQQVENALEQATQGELSTMHDLLAALTRPYDYQEKIKPFMQYDPTYDAHYRTYCGT